MNCPRQVPSGPYHWESTCIGGPNPIRKKVAGPEFACIMNNKKWKILLEDHWQLTCWKRVGDVSKVRNQKSMKHTKRLQSSSQGVGQITSEGVAPELSMAQVPARDTQQIFNASTKLGLLQPAHGQGNLYDCIWDCSSFDFSTFHHLIVVQNGRLIGLDPMSYHIVWYHFVC